MAITLAFDVYGTLIDTAGISLALEKYIGNQAEIFSKAWREKQLEYSFRRGLMQNYCKFNVCTREALEYTCKAMDVQLTTDEKDSLMLEYKKLPPFADAEEALPRLQALGHRLFAFSNGPAADVTTLLENAGLESYFRGVVSTDDIQSFKPNPAVYAHFLRKSGATGAEAWLISGNPFDVIGALSAGMHGAWVKRQERSVFDPWEFEPTATVRTLTDLDEVFQI